MADYAFDNYRQDLRLGGKKIFYDRSMCKKWVDKDGVDSLSFADKFTLRIDNSADIKFTDHIDDTGTTQTYRFGSRITYDLVGRLVRHQLCDGRGHAQNHPDIRGAGLFFFQLLAWLWSTDGFHSFKTPVETSQPLIIDQ